jgi:hypothetical protein
VPSGSCTRSRRLRASTTPTFFPFTTPAKRTGCCTS